MYEDRLKSNDLIMHCEKDNSTCEKILQDTISNGDEIKMNQKSIDSTSCVVPDKKVSLVSWKVQSV